ncbi:hypothetical protein B0H19DRAFT_1063166 [Mycena capillaripes]|nr:hypothetical protein B0H19DRAFT_1063166 [Mycena capillaripes]
MRHSVSVIVLAALLTESYAGPIKSRTPTTQYHVTCRTAAASIEKQIKGKTLRLGPGRAWPDEFTWSEPGGLYVTPNRANAEAFGIAFRDCSKQGGLVTMEFSLDLSKVKVNPLGDSGSAPQHFWDTQYAFGGALRAHLTHTQPPPTLLWSPPTDDGLDLADNPTSEPRGPVPPTAEQIAVLKKDASTGISSAMWAAYDALAPYDVVTGTVPLNPGQQAGMNRAVKMGLPPIKPPFEQVVLVTNTALSQLKYVEQYTLDHPLTKKQRDLVRELSKMSLMGGLQELD